MAPEELHKAIKEINDEFVNKLHAAMKEAESADGKALPVPAPSKMDPIEAAMAKNQELRNLGEDFLQKWKDGFFTLDWALVKELHEEGFTWGGTFSSPDLHHFEL